MAYSTLKPHHIRVLEIEPSTQHDSVITGSLKVISLSDRTRPQYEALSYVWGDAAERKEILLDAQPILITQNLWTALKYIRKPEASRTLWIDAICINQDDMSERTEQVKQMGQIFSQASTVLIWLGPPNAEIEKTMLALQIPGAVEALEESYESFPEDIALGLHECLSQPWWHRIWVIQEHVLASADPIVGCGFTWLKWPRLEEAIRMYTFSIGFGTTFEASSSTWVTNAASLIKHILFRRQWNDPKFFPGRIRSISEIIERTRGYQATDKRDQVFAVANLLYEKDKEQFPAANYTKSVSEVYQEATVAFLQSAKALDFLSHASSKDDIELGLPSWCVDFSKRSWQHGDFDNYRSKDENQEKIQEYMSVLSHNISQGTLEVLGGVLSQIIDPKPVIPPLVSFTLGGGTGVNYKINYDLEPLMETEGGRLTLYHQFFQAVLNISKTSCKIWADQHGVQEAKERLAAGEVWKSIIFRGGLLFDMVDAACKFAGIEEVTGPERPYDFWIVEAYARRECSWYADAIEKMGFLHPTPELSDSPILGKALLVTLMTLIRTCFDKWWFVTDTGYIACVDQKVEAGDQVCTIIGCHRPVVLRPCDSGFQLIDVPYSEDFYTDQHRERVREMKREIFTLR